MTSLAKITIISGICEFTIATLLWITQGQWEWFAGGAAVFVATLLTAIVLSVETRPTDNKRHPMPTYPSNRHKEEPEEEDEWQPPNTPPPDDEQTDSFFSPPPSKNTN